MDTLGRVVRNLGVMAGLFLLSSVVMTPAMAALITYDFTGEVTRVDPQLASQFHPSQTMSFSVTVNTTNTNPSPNIGPSPSLGIYDIQNSHITIGTYTATATIGAGEIVTSPGLFKINELVTGNTVDSLAPDRFVMFLSGPSTSNLFTSNDALVIPPPSIASFPPGSGQIALGFYGPSVGSAGGPIVGGSLTSLTAVPLPAAVLLFGGGLGALLGLGAGGLRKQRASQA